MLGGPAALYNFPPGGPSPNSAGAGAGPTGAGNGMSSQLRRVDYSHDVPPLGCNADAMKLFVGNIPKSYTADSLRPLFESIGTVVELVVVRDKLTDESKGSAFVWYQSRAEAERAIAELHLRRVLQDPTGEQDRPLVVRRANPKVPPVLLPSSMMPNNSFHGGPCDLDLPAHLQGAFPGVSSRHSLEAQFSLGSPGQMNQMVQELNSALNLPSPHPTSLLDPEQLFGGRVPTKNQNPLNHFLEQNSIPASLMGQQSPAQQQQPPPPPPHTASNPSSQLFPSLSSLCSHPASSLSNAPTNSNFSSVLSSSLAAAAVAQNNGSLGFGQMTLALHVSRSQGSILGSNLHNIQGNSGALVQLAPGSGDSYVVLLSGNDSQLDTAKNMVQDLVSQSAI